MKKAKQPGKNRSEVSLASKLEQAVYNEYVPPLDVLHIKVLKLEVPDDEPKRFHVKAVFLDQLVLSGTMMSSNKIYVQNDKLNGEMNYDPSDYQRMGWFADTPLHVTIRELKKLHVSSSTLQSHSSEKQSLLNAIESGTFYGETYCSNIDILPLFTGTDRLLLRECMKQTVKSVLLVKSWKNLPILTLELKLERNVENYYHQKILTNPNIMKITVVGCYNMKFRHNRDARYTVLTQMPICNDKVCENAMFDYGRRVPKKYNSTCFVPHWERLRCSEYRYTKDNNKECWNFDDMTNDENFDLKYYTTYSRKYYTTLWASYHRTLILKDSEEWLADHIRRYKWPLEVHVSLESDTYSLMTCLDLSKLIYPGETSVRLAVPLHWMDAQVMMEKCGCNFLYMSMDMTESVQKSSKPNLLFGLTSTDDMTSLGERPTGNDDNDAFVLIEVSLTQPLKKPCIPPHIKNDELKDMLNNMIIPNEKRKCGGRGYLDKDWQETVEQAAGALRTIPYHGITDICTLSRQLNVTRTRVELETSFWMEAAKYVNNNFVLEQFLHSKDTFEEMIMMTHACLMRITKETLFAPGKSKELHPTIRAARHARQMQDVPHALELYLQMVIENKRDADSWRELSTCLKDVDKDWANACLNKSINLDPRHSLSLLSKACLILEHNPDEAEPFFITLLGLYPLWPPVWVASSAYYYHRELYETAEKIMDSIKITIAEGVSEQLKFPRAWSYELGDWWDQTPLLPGYSLYYDATDLLLRLRCITLAEVCLSRALVEVGPTPIYYHLLGLCCRLRGDYDGTLCHLKLALGQFPSISYLKSLEGECHFKKGNWLAAKECFTSSASYSGPFITLMSLSPHLPKREPQETRSALVDLLRRQPSAYAWMTFAEFWLAKSAVGEGGDAGKCGDQHSATSYAIACAEQALNWDRRCGAAWALLSKLVKPSARRLYCEQMAVMCDYRTGDEEEVEYSSDSRQSLCYRLGHTIKDCRCKDRPD